MLTQEDLQALETLFDKKLEPIKQDIVDMKQDISNMKKDITGMKQDINDIREDLAEVRGATNYIAEWVEGLEKKVDRAM